MQNGSGSTDFWENIPKWMSADFGEEQFGKNGFHHNHVEGYNNANWILLDYSDILIHVFDTESRGFYDLERMWRDGKVVDIAEFK